MTTLIAQPVWGSVQRPWGWEVRVDFVAEAGRIHNEVLTFEKEPGEKVLDAAIAALTESLTARLAVEAAAALKPREATREELAAKVVVLEAEKAALTAERDTLIAAKPAVEVRR